MLDLLKNTNWIAAETILFPLLATLSCSSSGPKPLTRAFAHSDCLHQRPLLDALDKGFCYVEADVHKVESSILVAHDRDKCFPAGTLQTLYLDPLRERASRNGGKIYPDGSTLTLLIDVKTDADPTYEALDEIFRGYSDILTEFRGGEVMPRAVNILISGNRAISKIESQPVRYASIDGRLPDLDRNPSPNLYPMISADWKAEFHWNGTGTLPDNERLKLKSIVDRCHQQHKLLRFWGLRDSTNVWQTLSECKVDVLISDNLDALRDFLVNNHK